MRQRWLKIGLLVLAIAIGLTFFIHNEIRVYAELKALARDDSRRRLTIDVLTKINEELVNEASKWRHKPKKPRSVRRTYLCWRHPTL